MSEEKIYEINSFQTYFRIPLKNRVKEEDRAQDGRRRRSHSLNHSLFFVVHPTERVRPTTTAPPQPPQSTVGCLLVVVSNCDPRTTMFRPCGLMGRSPAHGGVAVCNDGDGGAWRRRGRRQDEPGLLPPLLRGKERRQKIRECPGHFKKPGSGGEWATSIARPSARTPKGAA